MAAERMEGCLARIQQVGLKAIATVPGDFSYEAGRAGVEQIIRKSPHPPSAIVVANDMMALGALDGIRHDHHLRVPEDISVVGFDGVAASKWASYGLTTVRQPVEQMASAAVSLLLACVSNPARPPEQRFFSGVLVSGQSTRLSKV